MTISGTTVSVTVQGDGLTTTFSYDFYMAGSSDYAVLVFTDTDGTETTITASDFSITGLTDQDGGTFTYPLSGSPIATSTSLRLSRVLPLVQNVAIGNQGNFYPSVVEQGLDYLTMIAQQQAGASGSIDAESLFGNPQGSSAPGVAIPIGSGLSFSGNTLVVSGVSGSGTVTQINTTGSITGGPITGVGTISLSTITTGYVLANFSGAAAAPQGVQLVAGSGITFSGTTTSLTLTASADAMVLITMSTPTGTGVITFDSIPSTYKHLFLFVEGRSTGGASPAVDVQMTFNNDTGSNYDVHGVQIGNTTISNFNVAAGTNIGVGLLPWSSSTTNNAGYGEAHIFNYTDTNLFKRAKISRSTIGATSVGATWVSADGGAQWRSTASITRIDLTLSAGNYTDGSIASLYGLT